MDHVTQHVGIWYLGENEYPGVTQLPAYEAPANRDPQLESWLRKEMDGRYSWKWLKMQICDLQKHTKWTVFKYSYVILWKSWLSVLGSRAWVDAVTLLHHTVHGTLLCYLKMNLDSCGAFLHVASISPSQLSQAEGELHPAQLAVTPTSSLDSPAELTSTSLQRGRGTGHTDTTNQDLWT